MAKISPELKLTLANLQQLLLGIVDEAKAADLYIQISKIQISRLLLRTAEIQPIITPDMLGLHLIHPAVKSIVDL